MVSIVRVPLEACVIVAVVVPVVVAVVVRMVLILPAGVKCASVQLLVKTPVTFPFLSWASVCPAGVVTILPPTGGLKVAGGLTLVAAAPVAPPVLPCPRMFPAPVPSPVLAALVPGFPPPAPLPGLVVPG